MVTLLTILHIAVCVFLILVVLLQPGKSGGMGAAFGGASQAVFGARGATSFLGKVTAGCAVLFMLTSIGLSYFATSKEKSLREESERQEERAKAREIEPTKARAKTKAGAMSEPEDRPAPAKQARDEEPAGAQDEEPAGAHDEEPVGGPTGRAPEDEAAGPGATKRPSPAPRRDTGSSP
ncbi:MAG: preprotein translocase subunit SecG [Deltaproteobacteria bacterium]|nr:preprotein translocase subunit SecG [Deltaproteobacteria bacterium]